MPDHQALLVGAELDRASDDACLAALIDAVAQGRTDKQAGRMSGPAALDDWIETVCVPRQRSVSLVKVE